jgi:MFS family permease
LQNLIWGAAQPFTGMLADRFGAAKTIVAGAVLYAFGLVAMAFAQTPGELVFSAGLLVGLGLSGTTFAVVLGAVSRAVPPARRSHAMGVATALGSFGQFAMLPGSLSLIAWVGWSAALIVLACIAATMVPLAGPFREIQPVRRCTAARRERGGARRSRTGESGCCRSASSCAGSTSSSSRRICRHFSSIAGCRSRPERRCSR